MSDSKNGKGKRVYFVCDINQEGSSRSEVLTETVVRGSRASEALRSKIANLVSSHEYDVLDIDSPYRREGSDFLCIIRNGSGESASFLIDKNSSRSFVISSLTTLLAYSFEFNPLIICHQVSLSSCIPHIEIFNSNKMISLRSALRRMVS